MSDKPPVVGVVGYFVDAEAAAQHGFGRRGLSVFALNYFRKLLRVGLLPIGIPAVDPDEARAYLGSVDGIVLTGGADIDPSFYGEVPEAGLGVTSPERDRFELELAGAAVSVEMPILGICRGLQVVNVALGGTLNQHLEPAGDVRHGTGSSRPAYHQVSVTDTSLAGLLGRRVTVNSFHHQAIARVADQLVVGGRSDDGIVELVGSASLPVLAVQWHPEQLQVGDPAGDVPFAWFAKEVKRRGGSSR